MDKLSVNGIGHFLTKRQPLIPSERISDKHISIYYSFFENPSNIINEATNIFGIDSEQKKPTLEQIRIALIMAQDALTIVGHRFGLSPDDLALLQLPSTIQDRTSGLKDLLKQLKALEYKAVEKEQDNSNDEFSLADDDWSDLISSSFIDEQNGNGNGYVIGNGQSNGSVISKSHKENETKDEVNSDDNADVDDIIKKAIIFLESKSHYKNESTSQDALNRSEKRLELINYLKQKRNEPPILTDSVLGWFRTNVAERLIGANINTLGALLHVINHKGWHWYADIHQLGQETARQIHEFIQKTSNHLGEQIHPFAQRQRKDSSILVVNPDDSIIDIPSSTNQVIVRKTAVTPLELFALPHHLTGEVGTNREQHHLNKLSASNDHEAIIEWLGLHQGATKEAYKKEAERLLLWSIIEKRKAFSSLRTADFIDYKDFLSDPQPSNQWVANKRYPRAHPNWKPFTGKLSRNTISYSFTVINALFEFLVSQQYLQSNPVRGVPRNIRSVKHARKMDRLIPVRLWNYIDDAIMSEKVENTISYRTAFLIKFIYLTGLRLEEIANVKLGDFHAIENDNGELSWRLKVIGKGLKERSIVIVEVAQRLLFEYLLIRNLPADPRLNEPDIFLISPIGKTTGLSNSRIYDSIKEYIFRISLPLEKTQPLDFQLLNRISTHWIRHTFASRLAKNAELSIVMKMLGHSSLQTTSIYVQAEDKESEQAMEAAFGE